MKYVLLLILGAIISSAIIGVSIPKLLLLFLSFFIIVFISKQRNIFAHSSKFVVLFVVVISVLLMPAFGVVTSRYGQLSTQDNKNIIEFGATIVLIVSICCAILKPVSTISQKYLYRPSLFSDRMMLFVFLCVFPISIFSYAIGLGRMGSAAVVLPFHLTGIFVFFQTKLVPALFVVYVENKILHKKKVNKKFYICYAAWSILMTLVLLSKSVFITNFIPLLIMLNLYYRPDKKTILRYLIPIVIFFFFMYPIIGILRLAQEDGKVMNATTILEAAYSDDDSGSQTKNDNFLLRPLNRVFKTGAHFYQDYEIIKNDVFFDFSRMPTIISIGGTARYQTIIIEGYTETANHSSGTSGIMDPILVGGIGLLYITIFLIMLLAAFVDRLYQKHQYSIYAILIFFVFDLICNHNVSLFFEYTSLIVTLLSVYIAYFFNFRKKGKEVVLSKVY